MNKNLRIGLYLQIPNAVIILGLILAFLTTNVNWLGIYNDLFLILGISIYSLINIFSLRFIVIGLTMKGG